jgi:uncharacterized membrane protein
MNWLWVLVGLFVGLSVGAADGAFFGAVLGGLLGYGAAQVLQLRRRLDQLERELARLAVDRALGHSPAETAGTAEPQQPDPPRPVVAAQPVAAPASGWARPAPVPASAAATADDGTPPREAPAAASPFRAFDAVVGAARDWFLGGNTLVRVGVVVLFFGVAFLLRYVAERTELPMSLRLAGVALGAIVMLVFGWRLRQRRAGYALALQGGAVAILYLTIFVALRLYSLLPPAIAFALMVAITAFAVALAVLQNSLSFAMFAAAGGFAAPLLASTGQGDHVTLFSYYAILNAGLVGIAWFRAWRPLVLLGFLFTFIIGTVWGVLRYRSELFASTEPFLALFFIMYVAIAVLFALRQPPQLRGLVDGTLVFGVPVTAFALQSALLREHTSAGGFGLAFSALAVGALYLGLAAWLWRRHRETLRLLTESFLALGVAFLTLAVPLALDGHWSAATWALEGAALVWVGARQNRLLPRAAGLVLQVGAGLLFGWRGGMGAGDPLPFINSGFLGAVMIAGAAVFSAIMLERIRERLSAWQRPAAALIFVWGLLWWTLRGLAEVNRGFATPYESAAAILFLSATALLASELARRTLLPMARWAALALLPALWPIALSAVSPLEHPFGGFGWLAWPVAFAVLVYLLRQHVDKSDRPLAHVTHAGSLWLITFVIALELIWLANQATGGMQTWNQLAVMLVPTALLAALPALTQRIAWPFAAHATSYRVWAAGGLAAALVVWLIVFNAVSPGDSTPLPYVPLANPLDIASGIVVFTLARHWLTLAADRPAALARWDERIVWGVLAALGFYWLNAALLRAMHQLAGVPFELDTLLASTTVQVALSIFWTVLALGTMLLATRRANRVVWLVGAVLLGIVVAKLFLIDLSRVGSIERIISFVVVGLLMLVIGWFSPLPPPKRSAAASALSVLLATGLVFVLGAAAPAPLRAADGDALTPNDFAYGFTLTSAIPEAPAYRLALPFEVYRQRVRDDLGDLRIFNADGQSVPHQLRRVTEFVADAAPFQSLPVYPLRGDARRATEAMRLRIESGTAGVELTTTLPTTVSGAAATTAEPPAASYIIDARKVEGPIARLRLQWRERAGEAGSGAWSAGLRLESSDDLNIWRAGGSGSVAHLVAGDTTLVANEIALENLRGRFYRLTWLDAPPPVVIERADVQRSATRASVPRQKRIVPGRAAADAPNVWEYDLGASLPVDRLALRLPELNSVARLSVQWRARDDDAWQGAPSFVAYRFAAPAQGEAGEFTSTPQALGLSDGTWVRTLRLTPQGGANAVGNRIPELEVGWVAHEVRFVGRGNAPFLLAYGSGAAARDEAPLEQLVPGFGTSVPVATATIGEARTLGGPDKRGPPRLDIDWLQASLWAVLIFGVGLLGWMALKLGRELRDGEP